MKRGVMAEAPNYTTPALVMGAINLFWILTVIWAVYGFLAVVAIGYALDLIIKKIGRRA